MTPADCRALYDYNRWANRRVFAAASALSGEGFVEDRGSSFGSVRDTLTHIYAAEWVWLQRWQGSSPAAYPPPEDFPSVESLAGRWEELERDRAAFLATLTDAALEREVAYTNVQGERWRYPLEKMLQHVANHSTYHRGQVVTLLRQLGAKAPGTDLLLFLDETGDTRAPDP